MIFGLGERKKKLKALAEISEYIKSQDEKIKKQHELIISCIDAIEILEDRLNDIRDGGTENI